MDRSPADVFLGEITDEELDKLGMVARVFPTGTAAHFRITPEVYITAAEASLDPKAWKAAVVNGHLMLVYPLKDIP